MQNAIPLAVANVHKRYGQVQVLNAVSLALQPGEIFGLIGLNGAGKTTLIKIMLDLADADAGTVSMFGEDSHHVAARQNISYLPEKFQPSRYLKGKEYLDLALSYYGKSFSIQEARSVAAALDLDPDKLDFRVGAYSKGMGQKLGLVGAFLADAPLLILDEPMSGLDPSARIKLKQEMLALKHSGRTIFFSSHILSDIDEICDRIGVIHDGRMLFTGTPSAFKQAQNETGLERGFLKAIGQ